MEAIEKLKQLNVCYGALNWVEENNLNTIEEIVSKCERGDWLLWLSNKLGIDIKPITLAKALCAKTVIHLMKDERSIKAIEVAERFGKGEVTIEELNAAAYAADAAATAAAATAADAAATDAAATAADAADAADAAYAAAAYAAYAAAAADAAAKKENQKQTADICREILGKLIIEKF
jgi:hypothetical protein